MAGPIGYVPPANPYAAMPLEQPKFTGLNVLPAQAAATQAMAPVEQKIQQSEQIDDQAKKAAEFQRLLSQGVSGLQSYVSDVQKDNPELAGQFGQELQTMSPLFQNLKGKELNDAVFNMYDSWNGRYNGTKLGKVMADPNSTEKDVFGAYSQYGGNPDKMMGAYAGIQKTNAMMPYYQAKAHEADSHADYLDARPDLMKQLEEMKTQRTIRATRIRANTTGNKTNYQTTLKSSQASMREVDDTIAKLKAKIDKMDPMEVHYNGLDTEMHRYRSEKLKLQGWINKAIEKGAKPDDYFDVEAPDGIAAPTAPTAPAAPGGAPAAPSPVPTPSAPVTGDISSKAPDAALAAYYKAMTNQDPTSQDLEGFRAALRQDNR